jgi:hypothetical protein
VFRVFVRAHTGAVVTLLVAVATRPPPDSIWDYLELRRMARTPTLSYCSPLLFLCIPVFVFAALTAT